MKKLIYTLTILAFPLVAIAQDEIASPNTGKQIVSAIKDLEVEKLLSQTSEFSECRKMNEYKAGATEAERSASLKKAQDCFSKKLGDEKDPEKLQKLSETLNLQQYGLVQSNNIKSIQKYLSDKMYKSMTGVDPNETSIEKLNESLKFKNKKHIDQKTFVDMFKTQVGKNALYEVSRFCFENFRLGPAPTGPTQAPTTFTDYWSTYVPKTTLNPGNQVNDSGQPSFGTISDPSNKKKVFEDIFTSIQGASKQGMKEEYMSDFFHECGKSIVPLCDKFKATAADNLGVEASKVDANGVTTGAAACLAKSRIQDYKLALKNADLYVKRFQDMAAEDRKSLVIGLDKGQVPKLFGQSANDESIDDLTNNTATDIFEGGLSQDEKIKKEAEKCNNSAELSECEAFFAKGDQLDKAKHSLEMEMTIKRDAEMARVKLLVAGDQQKLDEYLEANGYFDIIEALKGPNPPNAAKISTMVGESFEAKKQAVLLQINNKLGKRQVSEKAKSNDLTAVANAKAVASESKEERSRLAQVVLFNNIITSHLTLSKQISKNKYQEVGRNINAWKKEAASLSEAQVDPQLFQNLQDRVEGKDGIGKESEIAGFQLLDQILGKQQSP